MKNNYSKGQLTFLVALRFAIGWIMLYQGIVKFYTPGWTSQGYLLGSEGWFASIFQAIGNADGLIAFIDILNVYGQIAIGLGLILGLFVNAASIAGIAMLLMYYLAYPPFPGLPALTSDVIVNDLAMLIIGLLVVIYFPTSHIIGLKRFFNKSTSQEIPTPQFA